MWLLPDWRSLARNTDRWGFSVWIGWSMSASAIVRQLNMKPANRRDERFSLLGCPRERRVISERNGDQRRDDGGDVDEEVFPGMCRGAVRGRRAYDPSFGGVGLVSFNQLRYLHAGIMTAISAASSNGMA
ncbi:MAG: hypothetical protein QOH35_461 [Acidobacteriaceae bacterium]|jgi:hypothetical protein|nr:hypothetical protein [Acidobacteriaceae bacterium]